ncbi:hypothetical protein [Rhodococcus rhodochrous]|uniref:hypothetical protein n=1 Tax=Rhodococcus rhodochrous TaxID=1829 RepID=UPI001780065D|nr:hypothetical protein [Rhodococcus rhodochrous]QOH59855.1 hypothetical protein C6Y44_27570 [Rhodococcus rhodochrous]
MSAERDKLESTLLTYLTGYLEGAESDLPADVLAESLADFLTEEGYRQQPLPKDAETEYWTAGRDSHGNIRLSNGKGRLVAHAASTRDEVQLWHEHAANGLRRARYAAALELFDREAAGGQR